MAMIMRHVCVLCALGYGFTHPVAASDENKARLMRSEKSGAQDAKLSVSIDAEGHVETQHARDVYAHFRHAINETADDAATVLDKDASGTYFAGDSEFTGYTEHATSDDSDAESALMSYFEEDDSDLDEADVFTNATSALERYDGQLPAQCRSAVDIPRKNERRYEAGSSRGKRLYCDQHGWGSRWYKYPGYKIIERSPGTWRCGTHAPGYLTGKPPTANGATSTLKICYHWSRSCQWSNNIHVTNCGGHYVYYLPRTPVCHLAYCFTRGGPPAQNCVWNSWGAWGGCNKKCGGGRQSRSRSVRTPALNGGRGCSGPSSESRACNSNPCPQNCRWNSWGAWSQCSKKCGGGSSKRSRSKIDARHGGAACAGDTIEQKLCNSNPCPVDGKWDAWLSWGACSVTCGGGKKERSRIMKQEAKHGGKQPDGEAKMTDNCGTNPCPINCKWASWEAWEDCSKTCGGGEKKRARDIEVEAQHGGKECSGKKEEEGKCNEDDCPTTTTTTTTTAKSSTVLSARVVLAPILVCVAAFAF